MLMSPDTKVRSRDGYDFHHHYDSVVIIKGEGDIEFSAAEATKVVEMLNSIGKMIPLKRIPPFMNSKPFSIAFSKEGVCRLTRNNEEKGIEFPMADVDVLIEGTQEVVNKLIDLKRLTPNPNTHTSSAMPDVPWTGR